MQKFFLILNILSKFILTSYSIFFFIFILDAVKGLTLPGWECTSTLMSHGTIATFARYHSWKW